ncbi:MAG: cupin domain-containing protein [Opitutales bacterium]|nr:cupin domain-containing protein [Opitutales bacterium]
MEAKTVIVENLAGGAGHAIMKHLIGPEQMKTSARLYAQVTLEPGCEIGVHRHLNESETYYILAGTGVYDDDGVKREVKAGDITFTGHGHSHGLLNTGTENLVLMALILLEK